MDLINFTSDKANVPVDVIIKHPVTNEPTDIVIQVLGLDSTSAQACLDQQQAVRFKKMMGSGEDAAPEFDPEINRQNLIELLVACTAGWKNVQFGGEALEYTRENAVKLYTQVPALRDQVSKASGSRKLFFKD